MLELTRRPGDKFMNYSYVLRQISDNVALSNIFILFVPISGHESDNIYQFSLSNRQLNIPGTFISHLLLLQVS